MGTTSKFLWLMIENYKHFDNSVMLPWPVSYENKSSSWSISKLSYSELANVDEEVKVLICGLDNIPPIFPRFHKTCLCVGLQNISNAFGCDLLIFIIHNYMSHLLLIHSSSDVTSCSIFGFLSGDNFRGITSHNMSISYMPGSSEDTIDPRGTNERNAVCPSVQLE